MKTRGRDYSVTETVYNTVDELQPESETVALETSATATQTGRKRKGIDPDIGKVS